MSPSDWQPSAAYLEYAATMRKQGTLRPEPATPFDPCDRYRRLSDSCATCAHSIEDVPCPDLKEVFAVAFPTKGGDLSTPVNDGSGESGPGGEAT